MPERMIPGLSHSRGTGLTIEQMQALDAERRRLDADRLAARVAAAAPKLRPAPETSPSGPASRSGAAERAGSGLSQPPPATGPQIAAPASSSRPTPATPTGPTVIEVGKALQQQAARRAKAERLDALDRALDAALRQHGAGGQHSFTLGGR